MRILAIESSGVRGSVAALADGNLVAELELSAAQRGAQALAPAISELLKLAVWKPRDIGLVAVSTGPGSFTALRVGVTTAKAFAYAVSAEVLGVGSLEVIAAQAAGATGGGAVAVAIDAQRGDVYSALFRGSAADGLECIEPVAIRAADDWLANLPPDCHVSGPALDALAEGLALGVRIAPREAWRPLAATLGRLAVAKHAAGQHDDLWRLVPLYLRKSAAEERRPTS